jgi:glycosyltransferase involved in cell wall biosynthesis
MTLVSHSSQSRQTSNVRKAPAVAVTIPTRDSADTLEGCLRSVTEDAIRCEIVVADDCSTDGTQEIARRFGARILEGPLPLLEARYRAMNATDAEHVILLDSDQVLEPGALGRCVELLERYDALVLEERSGQESTWIERLYAADKRYLHAADQQHLDPVHGSLLPRAFRRSILVKAFESIPEDIRLVAVAQDHAIIYEAFSRVSSSIAIVPHAVRHQEMKTFGELWRKYFKWGAGLVELFEQGPDYRRLTHAKMRGRLHRGSARFDDFLASLLLMALKVVPYGMGYATAAVTRRLRRPKRP